MALGSRQYRQYWSFRHWFLVLPPLSCYIYFLCNVKESLDQTSKGFTFCDNGVADNPIQLKIGVSSAR